MSDIIVTIRKRLPDSLWGFSELLTAMPDASKDEQDDAILELLNEDVAAVLDDAKWEIERARDE